MTTPCPSHELKKNQRRVLLGPTLQNPRGTAPCMGDLLAVMAHPASAPDSTERDNGLSQAKGKDKQNIFVYQEDVLLTLTMKLGLMGRNTVIPSPQKALCGGKLSTCIYSRILFSDHTVETRFLRVCWFGWEVSPLRNVIPCILWDTSCSRYSVLILKIVP